MRSLAKIGRKNDEEKPRPPLKFILGLVRLLCRIFHCQTAHINRQELVCKYRLRVPFRLGLFLNHKTNTMKKDILRALLLSLIIAALFYAYLLGYADAVRDMKEINQIQQPQNAKI